MLFLLSGSSGAGKTTVGPAVAAAAEDIAFHDVDEERDSPTADRIERLDGWIARALTYAAAGRDMLLASQSPFGELLACPRAAELDAIAGCVLDCDDFVRADRLRSRPPPHDAILGMDILCWAVFHRMHARDPRWEQRVICTEGPTPRHWGRWRHWERDDPRWDVPIIDTSAETPARTARDVARWIEERRARPPLRRADAWWGKAAAV